MASKIKAYHFGTIEGGKLKLADRPKFQCAANALEGKEVRLTIERKPVPRKNASDQQRRYYWAVICQIIGDSIGCTPEEAHDSLKAKFLSSVFERDGGTFTVIHSTEALSTIEREDYHRNIREWASLFLKAYIPLPNEVEF
jgi:hypothetical protein